MPMTYKSKKEAAPIFQNHVCDTFLLAATTIDGPITKCSQCGEYHGSGMVNFADYQICGICGVLVHREHWLKMGKIADGTEVCFECYVKEDCVLY
jgi:ribosomal protein S27AE